MPPVQHSSSSRSAHKDSDQIPADQNYSLGDYSFRIERTSVPGSTNDKIEAICTDKDGKNARKSIQVPSSTQMLGWYVEANGTTADVYAYIDNSSSPSGLNLQKIYGSISGTLIRPSAVTSYSNMPGIQTPVYKNGHYYFLCAGETQITQIVTRIWNNDSKLTDTEEVSLSAHYEKEGKTVYYSTRIEVDPAFVNWGVSFTRLPDNVGLADAAWELIYSSSITNDQILIGRFAIDLKDAGGVGPEGEDEGWDDPDDYYDDDYDDYEDTEEYDDELYLELDKWDGEPGESFTVTITGHNGESVIVSVQPNDATEEILTYRLYAPASKDAPLTYTFTTDESWMADGIYSRAFLVTATTDETTRTANDGFTLYVEEPDMLTVDTDMDEEQPGETITAYVGGHSGHTFSAVVTNAVGDIVATFSQVVPQSQYSDVELPIALNEAWFSSNSSSETLIITATTDDNRQASAVFKMVLEPLEVSLDVDKYMAEVGEDVTWSMEAEGGNGNYQYNFFIFLDGELIRDGRWQFDSFLTYTPHSPGTYTVEGYAKDSRLSQNVKAPEDGEVIVEGEPEPEPEPEPDEITRTLYITVTGALSGRHNDPGKDPSYSYLPADKDTVKDYGCGGDGGHGGGGGAGASNVVVYKFATDKADSKEITAITKRPGFGSGGGKGGKGGDGCILIYY
jgi:hypothetical protein